MPLNLMGPVASVFARTTTRVNPIEVEDCAVASLVMQSRALARSPPHSALAPRDQSAALLLRLLRARDLRERACALFARRRPVADWCSQKDGFTWDRMTKLADGWLPAPRILHPWPEQRFA